LTPVFIVGIILFSGFILGEICTRLGLPKVTGYIIAGIALNPDFTAIVPKSFLTRATLVTDIALAFITFSVGGTLSFSKLRTLGRPVISITLLEAEFAFLLVSGVFVLAGPAIFHQPEMHIVSFYTPLAILLASLASPTDPSATLAIVHEYKAKGQVTSTIMAVAAFDDILGILNFSLAISIAEILMLNESFALHSITLPLVKIVSSIIIGGFFGLVLNFLSKKINDESEGMLISLIISLLSLSFGAAGMLNADELLSTMTMGVVVVNYNVLKDQIFKILERYTEELIFILFFTISAMHLDFSVLVANYLAIIVFVLFRNIGKFSGTFVGGILSGSSISVRKFTAGGLIPQGGIVIGLALVIRQNPSFHFFSDVILNVIIGATIVHELIGPIISKLALRKAGEIS
jgi:Kef-type K+ transport system membrane component KefB